AARPASASACAGGSTSWTARPRAARCSSATAARRRAACEGTPPAVTAAPAVGRFAPSPTGPLHAGSLVAALASWLDARAQGGRWLVRIEDVDGPRCVPSADALILAQLARCGLVPDEPPMHQSARGALYRQ